MSKASTTTILRATYAANATGGGTLQELIPAKTGMAIRIYGAWINVSANTFMDFASATTRIVNDATILLGVNYILPQCDDGWMQTASGEAFQFSTNSVVALNMIVLYAYV